MRDREVTVVPANSCGYSVPFLVPLGARAAAIVACQAGVAGLQCATMTDTVLFSLAVIVSVSYIQASSGATVTESFELPYADAISIPGTIAGMQSNPAPTIAGISYALASPDTLSCHVILHMTVEAGYPSYDSRQTAGSESVIP